MKASDGSPMASYEYVSDDMRGRTCVVTGANSGIGRVAARELAAAGARVLMLCRNAERAEEARAEVSSAASGDEPTVVLCDLASFGSVRDAAAKVLSATDRIDVLLNNAGLIARRYTLTEDGHELTFQVNHLGHFLLTELLLDAVRDAPQGRVITVSSDAHLRTWRGIRFDDLDLERGWGPFSSYSHSKLANVMFGFELARRLEGTDATSNVVHPGGVDSGFGREGWGLFGLGWNLIRPLLLTPEQGAETLIYLATALEVAEVSGGYFYKWRPKDASPVAYDEVASSRLWEVSSEMAGLR